jgi:hypothetical protein
MNPPVAFEIDGESIRPLIAEVVAAVLHQLQAVPGQGKDRLAFTEREAAELLGLARHQLRDCRLRHEISASKVCNGRRILYTKADLVRFLAANASNGNGNARRRRGL